ncbi:hypothetical protein LLG46_15825 [bacterium]|nr:hypothetical protein [bacterium]
MNRSIIRGITLIILAAAVIIGLLLVPNKSNKNANHPPNDDPWLLVSYDPDNPYGTYLGNGFIGCRIMGEGVGSHNGDPLPCFMAGLYDNEKLIPTPTWSDLRFYDGKTEFTIDKNADYKQVLNMKTGSLTTYATWRAGHKTLKGKIEVIVSRAEPDLARLYVRLAADFHGHVRIKSPPSGNSPTGVDWVVGSCLSKTGSSVTGIGGMALDTGAAVEPGDKLTLDYYIMLFRSAPPKDAKSRLEALLKHPNEFVSEHKAAMSDLWKHDIIIDGPRRDQQAIHSCMFYLMQSVRESSGWSIPPMGLSGNAFNGHVFWDADLWMFPALILQHPGLARSIVDYRYNTLSGAIANAKEHGFAGAEYAWESGYTGREDTPEGLVYANERHINGDVALCQWQYYLATGDKGWLKTRGYPVLKATADYWVSRAKLNQAKDRYEILQVVPPDENAELTDNSAYTNIIAQMNLRIAMQAAKQIGTVPNPQWSQVAQKMYIPYDPANKRFIAHDACKPNCEAKQADTELIVYPLQYELADHDMTEIYKNTFEYYSSHVHPNGPAMSTSAYSVISARLGDCDRAYKEFVKSYKPYFRGPFNYFNEKPSKTYENMCFLTGAAGPIQSIIFGLAGAKVDYFAQDDGKILSWSACLPKCWKSIKLTGVQWRGKQFDVTVNRGNKVIIRPSQSPTPIH